MIPGMTIEEATHRWVSEFNAIPQSMIKRLLLANPYEWENVTMPCVGDSVYITDGEYDSMMGEIVEDYYDNEPDLHRIKLNEEDLGDVILAEDEFEVEHYDILPMWGTMWGFGDSLDNEWLENADGIRCMSSCGFRIYHHNEWGYFFGIDGAGYDFYENHWIPLYKKRGLQWHDPAAEEAHEMQRKGYRVAKVGCRKIYVDKNNNFVKYAN